MCLVPTCPTVGTPESIQAGLGAGVCAAHAGDLKLEVKLRYATDDDYLHDFVYIKGLMRYGTALVDAAWLSLNNELEAARVRHATSPQLLDERFDSPTHAGPQYVKLSRALEYYEGLCWFPINRISMPGLLDGHDFIASLKWGLAKDPGAGTSHGDLSHRFQWHAIMRIITAGFTTPKRPGWRKTPLELYIKLMEPNSAWGFLVDLPGTSPDGYSHPDNVLQHIVNDPNLTLIRPNAQRRYNSRLSLDTAIDTALNTFSTSEKPVDNQLNANVRKLVYEWKKLGGPPADARPRGSVARTFRMRMDLKTCAREVWNHVITHSPAILHNTRTLRRVPSAPGVLTSMASDAPMVEPHELSPIASQLMLNRTDYQYSGQRGAYPV